MLMFHETKQVFVVIYIGVAYVVNCPALLHVKMLPYNLTRQTSFLLPVLLFVALNIILCKLIESEEVGKLFALPEDLKLSDRIKSALNFKWF